MKKLITLFFITASLCTSCSDFKEKGKPLFKDLVTLYDISLAKCKITHKVWSTAIFDNRYALSDSESIYDYYVSDFSTAIYRMEKEKSIIVINNKIDSLSSVVEKKIETISDKKHDSYDKLLSLYSNVMELSKRAKTPTGSLQSFTSDVNQKEDEINKLITEIKATNPEFDK